MQAPTPINAHSAAFAQRLVSLPRPDAGRLRQLTAAESEVLGYMIEGRSPQEIAELRHARRRTVANQLAAARRKLRVSGRMELVRRLAELGSAGTLAACP